MPVQTASRTGKESFENLAVGDFRLIDRLTGGRGKVSFDTGVDLDHRFPTDTQHTTLLVSTGFHYSIFAKVTFHRDGSMSFGPGCSDVRSADWRREPAINADIKIYQKQGVSACFMDLRATGQTKSKMTSLEKPSMSPGETTEDSR